MYEIFEQLLQERGVSVYKVSKDTGIAQSTFSSWKTNRNKLSSEKIEILAKYFNVSIDFLMGMKSEKMISEQEINKKRLLALIQEYPFNALKTLSKLCEKERIERDMTEKFVSEKSEIALDEYLQFENEYKNIGIDNIVRLLLFFEFNLEYITGYMTGLLVEAKESVSETDKLIERLLIDEDFKKGLINDLEKQKKSNSKHSYVNDSSVERLLSGLKDLSNQS